MTDEAFVTYAVELEAMDEKSLRSVGIQNVDTAVVSIGENIEASILVVMILKEMGIKHIIAKAVTRLHGKVLENLGVNKVVYPERATSPVAEFTAQEALNSSLAPP